MVGDWWRRRSKSNKYAADDKSAELYIVKGGNEKKRQFGELGLTREARGPKRTEGEGESGKSRKEGGRRSRKYKDRPLVVPGKG